MGDLKLTGKTEEELQKQIQTVITSSNRMNMEFGVDNCAEIIFKKEKLVHSNNLTYISRETEELEHGKTYKCTQQLRKA